MASSKKSLKKSKKKSKKKGKLNTYASLVKKNYKAGRKAFTYNGNTYTWGKKGTLPRKTKRGSKKKTKKSKKR